MEPFKRCPGFIRRPAPAVSLPFPQPKLHHGEHDVLHQQTYQGASHGPGYHR
jgi:hypothetical protein